MSFAKIRPRRGTALQWETANPILAEGEIGIEVPNDGVGTGEVKIKFGDGVKTWTDLPYGVEPLEVVDNLLSESTELPLSANQGRILAERYKQAYRVASKNYTVTPTAEKSVIELPYDLTDVIPEGYTATSLIIGIVHYTNSHAYQQVTVTDVVYVSGTARLMVETKIQFSLRIVILCYKNEAFL